jgi:ribosome production factor 2
MGRKHDMMPFDDSAPVIYLCDKNDASLFIFGNHKKKRPQNITFGRLYNSKMLDMVELGIEEYKKMSDFKVQADFMSALNPLLIFQGEHFEYMDKYMKIRNLLAGKPNFDNFS